MEPNTYRLARPRLLWAAGIVAWIVLSGAGPSAAEPLADLSMKIEQTKCYYFLDNSD
jgi:hypothetical protein